MEQLLESRRETWKVLNGPVRTDSKHSNKKRKNGVKARRQAEVSKLPICYVFPLSKYVKFLHSSLSFSGLNSAVILRGNCSLE